MLDDRIRVLRHPIGVWEQEYEDLRGAQRHTAAYREIVRVVIPRRSIRSAQEISVLPTANEQDDG